MFLHDNAEHRRLYSAFRAAGFQRHEIHSWHTLYSLLNPSYVISDDVPKTIAHMPCSLDVFFRGDWIITTTNWTWALRSVSDPITEIASKVAGIYEWDHKTIIQWLNDHTVESNASLLQKS